jgi:ubiquitin C-terminal hydrolase
MSSVPQAKQVVMRPAYKRYLIASAPPVLIIQLKRFQQISKIPTLSFAYGFKKLDDYITFPEYLDLGPFLTPRKEDFGLRGKNKGKGKVSEADPCKYRLYAVVVHHGHMVSVILFVSVLS